MNMIDSAKAQVRQLTAAAYDKSETIPSSPNKRAVFTEFSDDFILFIS